MFQIYYFNAFVLFCFRELSLKFSGYFQLNYFWCFKIPLWLKKCFSNFRDFYKNRVSILSISTLHSTYFFTEVRRSSHLGIWSLTFLWEGYFPILDKYRVFQRGIFHSGSTINVKVPEGHYSFQVSQNDVCLKQPGGTGDCSSFMVRI